MSRFLSKRFNDLEAYTPGEQPRDRKYIKLNTNESPYPPSKEVISAVNAAAVSELNLYPDPACTALKSKLAECYGVCDNMVFVSNGSDDILNFSFMAFCDENKGIAFPDITYGFYEVFAALHGVKTKVIPLKEDFTIETQDYCNIGMNIVIANPNAPTGVALPVAEIERIVRSNSDSIVIIDEAYVDFGAESALPLVFKYDNIIIVRTYSKSRSMAGARLGFAIARPALIRDLETMKYSTNPYDINRLTQIAGIAALENKKYYTDNADSIIKTREYVSAQLKKIGFEVIGSAANFVFARLPGMDGEKLYTELRNLGILVRHFSKERIKDYLRITIGTKEEMDALLEKALQVISAKGENQ